MKNKKLTLLLVFSSVLLVFLLNQEKAYAERIPIVTSPEVNIVNDEGQVTSGPKFDVNNLLMVNYLGRLYTDFGRDITLKQYLGGTTNPAPTGKGVFSVGKWGIVRVKNAGLYRGNPITLAFQVMQDSTITLGSNTRGPFAMIPSSQNMLDTTVDMSVWFEDESGTRMNDPSIQVMFPYDAGNQTYKSGTWMYHNIAKEDGISNIFLRQSDIDNNLLNNVTIDDISGEGTMKTSFNFVQTDSGRNTFNILYNLSDKPLRIKEVYSNAVYPNISSIPNASLTEFAFFDKNALAFLKLKNNAPVAVDTVNDETFQMKMEVTQDLLKQSTANFYEDFKIAIDVPAAAKVADSTIKVTDYSNNDISDQLTFDTSTPGKLQVLIPKDVMESLNFNSLSITATLDLANQSADLMSYYNKDTQYFELPVTAKNQDHDTVSEAVAKVKMPAPTGEAVSQTVTLNQSTQDLKADQFVKNLSSSISDDTITVLGFQADKTFSKEGSDSVVVKIKSQLTGVEGTISIPVTVVKEEDKATLSWSNAESTAVTTKVQSLDKSETGDLLTEELFWQTSYLDKNYQLIVTNNGETLVNKATETSTKIDTWVSEELDIPINKLSYGENQLTVAIYSLDSNNQIKGDSLSQLTLTINVSGSLQLKTVPADLTWTERTVRDSKGTLTRDSGNKMTIEIVDTRDLAEDKKQWSLRSTVVSTNKVPFNLVWKDDQTTSATDLENKVVLTKDTSDKNGNNYTKTWSEDNGVLLSSESYLNVGDYSGQVVVNWQLYDTNSPG